jgi:hypothetical protein
VIGTERVPLTARVMSQDEKPRKPAPAGPTTTEPTPVEKDAAQPISGRQSQRPGQHGRHQPRPGVRDADTIDSSEDEGFAGPPASRGELPSSHRPRRGSRSRRG